MLADWRKVWHNISLYSQLVLTKNTPVLFMKGLILLDVKQCDAIKHEG